LKATIDRNAKAAKKEADEVARQEREAAKAVKETKAAIKAFLAKSGKGRS